jgi:hypothetical protein
MVEAAPIRRDGHHSKRACGAGVSTDVSRRRVTRWRPASSTNRDRHSMKRAHYFRTIRRSLLSKLG